MPTFELYSGAVEIMLRPEDLLLIPTESGAAEIIEREYFGQDQLLKVQLPSGQHLHSRLLGSEGDFQPGQRVDLRVRDRVVVYPA